MVETTRTGGAVRNGKAWSPGTGSEKYADMPDYEMVLKGTGACAGCPSPMALRIVGKALGPDSIMVLTPSCTVASTGMMPDSCFDVPVLNCCFASAGASAAGISGALDAQIAKGILPAPKPVVFTWIGDGGAYDIGFQGLSAAAERNDDFIYFCYNNEAYSNTGMQRSGATPKYASTTTTPAGKTENKKNMPLLMLEHASAYVATASVAYPLDLYRKAVKARDIKGFRYIEVHAPCCPGWKFPNDETVEIGRLAVNSGAWALWEAEEGRLSMSAPTRQIAEGKRETLPLEDYLKAQGRFDTVIKSPDKEKIIREMERGIQRELRNLVEKARAR